MNECDECGKETEDRTYLNVRTVNPDGSIKDNDMRLCKDCKIAYHNMYKKMARTVSELQVKVQRAMYEDKGDIKKLR